MIALARPIVCVVTGGQGTIRPAIAAIAAAARAGADLIHIREPGLDDRHLLDFVQRAIDAVRDTAARVLVNERVDVALAAGAAGVHLRERSMPASRVRAIVPPTFLVGRSVHSVDGAREAELDAGCEYLVFGTVFRSDSKLEGHPVAGLEELQRVCKAVHLPVVAIGGVTEARAASLAAAGAAGIAAISLFRDATSAASAVCAARRAFDTRS